MTPSTVPAASQRETLSVPVPHHRGKGASCLDATGTLLEGDRTTVIGILGAFGKIKATSENFPRRRKFSAIGILNQLDQT